MEEASEQNKNGHNISAERNGGELAALKTELRLLQVKDQAWILLSLLPLAGLRRIPRMEVEDLLREGQSCDQHM